MSYFPLYELSFFVHRMRFLVKNRRRATRERSPEMVELEHCGPPRGQELESKSRELVEVRSMLDNASLSGRNLSKGAEQQFHQLEQELKIAKEALAEMQRQAEGGESRQSSVEVRIRNIQKKYSVELCDV